MNRLAFAAVLATLVAVPVPSFADHKGKVPWVTNLEQGLAKARATGKPMMLYFSADW